MSDAPWTIERISEALGNCDLAQRFLGEINRAPAHELLSVFARWQQIAKDTVAALEQADDVVAYELRGEEPPGEWINGDLRLQEVADRIRARGAA